MVMEEPGCVRHSLSDSGDQGVSACLAIGREVHWALSVLEPWFGAACGVYIRLPQCRQTEAGSTCGTALLCPGVVVI